MHLDANVYEDWNGDHYKSITFVAFGTTVATIITTDIGRSIGY
jgi:hypothetical protein